MILYHRSIRVPLRIRQVSEWTGQDRASADTVLRAAGVRMCRGCDQLFPRSSFNPGGRGQCPPCHRLAVGVWRLQNPHKARANGLRRHLQLRQQSVPGAPVTGDGLAAKFQYWGGRCHLCGLAVDLKTFEWDHVKPVSRGGLHVLSNLRPSHKYCNQVKSARWVTLRMRTPCKVHIT